MQKEKSYQYTEAILYKYQYLKVQVQEDEEELNQLYGESALSSYDYTKIHVQNSNVNDSTFQEATKARKRKARLQKVVKDNKALIEKVEKAYKYLNRNEQLIVTNKYFKERNDYEIWMDDNLGLCMSERTYYRVKNRAVKKMSLIIYGK